MRENDQTDKEVNRIEYLRLLGRLNYMANSRPDIPTMRLQNALIPQSRIMKIYYSLCLTLGKPSTMEWPCFGEPTVIIGFIWRLTSTQPHVPFQRFLSYWLLYSFRICQFKIILPFQVNKTEKYSNIKYTYRDSSFMWFDNQYHLPDHFFWWNPTTFRSSFSCIWRQPIHDRSPYVVNSENRKIETLSDADQLHSGTGREWIVISIKRILLFHT